MVENIKKVSKKKILFVQIDEEITRIFERIEKLPYTEVYLVVPKRAILLQSVVNLKILKQKLSEIDKNMALITNDLNGMKLAHQAEIKVFDHWNMGTEAASMKEEKDPESALLKPVEATQNEVEEDLPSRLPKKKSSIFEVVRTRKKVEKGFSLRGAWESMKKTHRDQKSVTLYLTPGRKKWIFALVTGSILVFFVIAYVALPGATVYIEPASNVVSKAVNIVLEPSPSEPHSLKVYEVTADTEYTLTHSATGITSEGQNASGNLTVINTSGVERPLVTQTRFQTDDGIVFRLQKEVIVPAGTVASPGTIVVSVVADILDANGVAVGDRGNIAPTRFFLPGLKEDSRADLYAESYDAMTGGTTLVHVKVTEEDLLAAQDKLENDLMEKAIASLRKEALSLGNTNGINLKLLEDSDVIVYGGAIIKVPYELVGQEMDSFEITGSMSISGVAYDSDALYSILKVEIISTQTPGKQLISVDADSVSIQVLEVDNNANVYKMTAQIQGIEEYEIDSDPEAGNQLVEKIKEHIAGKTVEEATNYIENLPEVNTVEISLWPIWSPSIPSLPENIAVKSLSDKEAVVPEPETEN